MNVKDMKAEIASTSYPGRGILIGRSEDKKSAYISVSYTHLTLPTILLV